MINVESGDGLLNLNVDTNMNAGAPSQDDFLNLMGGDPADLAGNGQSQPDGMMMMDIGGQQQQQQGGEIGDLLDLGMGMESVQQSITSSTQATNNIQGKIEYFL